MKAFVINLPKDIERREAISKQLSELSLQFELVPAVYGLELSPFELSRMYDDRKAKLHQARSLVPAEIGCSLSHLEVYRRIISENKASALVLEDDVILPANIISILDKCEKLISNKEPSVYLLSPAEGHKEALHVIDNKYSLRQYKKGYFTSSYIVNLEGARALLKELHPVGDVADCWKRLQRHKIVSIFTITPFLINQDQDRFGSSTTTEINEKLSRGLEARVVYKIRRLKSIMFETLYTVCLKFKQLAIYKKSRF